MIANGKLEPSFPWTKVVRIRFQPSRREDASLSRAEEWLPDRSKMEG
jgi:hypothetical protein